MNTCALLNAFLINQSQSLSSAATAFCLKSPFPRFCVVLFFSSDEDDADFILAVQLPAAIVEGGRSWPIVTWRSDGISRDHAAAAFSHATSNTTALLFPRGDISFFLWFRFRRLFGASKSPTS